MRKTVAISLLLLLCVVLPARTPRQKVSVENRIVDVARLIGAGEHDKARTLLQSLASIDSTSDAVSYYLGVCEFESGRYNAAAEHFLRASELDTANLAYLDALGQCYTSAGKIMEAADIYKELMARNPARFSNPYVLTLLGDAEFNARRDTVALRKYDEALLYDPSYVPAVLGRSEVFRVRRDLPNYFDSLEPFASDAGINPTLKARYIDESLKRIDWSIFRSYKGRLDALVDRCVDTHPSDTSILRMAGVWYYGTQRKDKGEALLDRWFSLAPDDVRARFTRISLLIADERWEDVIEEGKHVVEICGSDRKTMASAYGVIGDSYQALGKAREGNSAYEKALKLNPDEAMILNNYAYYLSLQGKKLGKAATMAQKAIKMEPDNATFLDTYGWILYLQKKPSEAKPYFKHAMIYGGKDNKTILQHYSAVLRALGEDNLADYYQQLSEKK